MIFFFVKIHGFFRLQSNVCCRYPDEILSTKIIGERQFQKAVDLFTSAKQELIGKIDYRHYKY